MGDKITCNGGYIFHEAKLIMLFFIKKWNFGWNFNITNELNLFIFSQCKYLKRKKKTKLKINECLDTGSSSSDSLIVKIFDFQLKSSNSFRSPKIKQLHASMNVIGFSFP